VSESVEYKGESSLPKQQSLTLDHLDYYEILEISEDSTYHEIRKAYRRMVRKYHPDRNASDHPDMIKLINAAFEILSDKDKRKHYDVTARIRNKDTINKTNVMRKKNNQSYTFRNVPPYSVSNQNDNQSTSRYHHKERNRGGFRFRQSTSIRNEEKVPIVNEEEDKPPARFHITVEPTLCMAFGSCEILAPKVFILEKNKIINPKVRVESEDGATSDEILAAAETCFTKAIKLIDRHSGEQVYP